MYKRQVSHTTNTTKESRYRIAAKFAICRTNKSKFIKSPEEEIKQVAKKELCKKDNITEAKEIHAPVRK